MSTFYYMYKFDLSLRLTDNVFFIKNITLPSLARHYPRQKRGKHSIWYMIENHNFQVKRYLENSGGKQGEEFKPSSFSYIYTHLINQFSLVQFGLV